MDDFSTRTYGTSGLDNRPLFGETSARDRIINMAVGGFTSVVVLFQNFSHQDKKVQNKTDAQHQQYLVLLTVIGSFVFPSLPPRPLNVFFAVCILLACGSILVLIYWYRQGDLEPKFRKLIYYMLASIVLLCLCANLYFFDVR